MTLDVTTRSAEHERLLALAAETLPGGPLGYFRLSDEVQLVVREGRGSKLYDVDRTLEAADRALRRVKG